MDTVDETGPQHGDALEEDEGSLDAPDTADGAEDRAADGLAVVAEPVRYPRSPLVMLIVIAIVPIFALLVLNRWADREADRYDAGRAALAELNRQGTNSARASADPAEVATPLLDYRRVPVAVGAATSAERLGIELESTIDRIGDRSCLAVSAGGVPVASVNADVAVIPASNQKLLVAAVALDVLGPDFRFTTSVAAPDPVDGVVDGDIYLIGGGDPLLVADDFPTDDDPLPEFNTTSLDVLADAVVDAGIDRIRGTVIGDGSRYDDEWVVADWPEGIGRVEAGPFDALVANDGRVRGRSGRQDDPVSSAAREFVRLLGNRGVRVDNGWGSGTRSTLVPVIGSVESAPLSDVVAEMLTNSDNDTAEMLVKEIGFATSGVGARLSGLSAMLDRLESWGIDTQPLVLVDGSGLSSYNRVTCSALLTVLQRGAGGPLDEGMPIAGQTGTLSTEFEDTSMAGRLRAKTGTLGNPPVDLDPPAVKALSGYVDTPGAEIEFALVLNEESADQPTVYNPIWVSLGDRLATYPEGPPTGELMP